VEAEVSARLHLAIENDRFTPEAVFTQPLLIPDVSQMEFNVNPVATHPAENTTFLPFRSGTIKHEIAVNIIP